jgi:hypothetical protein
LQPLFSKFVTPTICISRFSRFVFTNKEKIVSTHRKKKGHAQSVIDWCYNNVFKFGISP